MTIGSIGNPALSESVRQRGDKDVHHLQMATTALKALELSSEGIQPKLC